MADLEAVRRHVGLGRMALLGHSWGAQPALSYAPARPGRVSALVYVSGTASARTPTGTPPTGKTSGPA
ncbi:alpha/beta fold hydrolase [Streptomyces sp. NPDC005209]|uniref:alpha/beta fold hydrolase n=1 Tax=Streptomyces sp. NPDC005209 TaxID=3156715 RepID=UPI0033A70C85